MSTTTQTPGYSNNGTQPPRGLKDLHLETLRNRLLTSDALDQLAPPETLIDTLLVRNTLAALYGPPGGGKSFLAMDWALSVATGTWWLGRRVHQGPVLYVAAEGSAGLAQRKQAWESDRGVDVAGFPIYWLPMAVNLLDQEWSAALVELCAELKPVLVVIDTLARSMVGGDENAAKDMSRVVDNADKVRIATGATVLVVHHTPKSGETLRGHSSLEGAVDTAIELKADGGEVTIKTTKQKDMPMADKILVCLRPVLVSAVFWSQKGLGPTDELGQSESTLLEAVMGAAGTNGLSATNLLEVSGMPRSSFFRALKALVDRGLVVNVGTTKQPRYADEYPDKQE